MFTGLLLQWHATFSWNKDHTKEAYQIAWVLPSKMSQICTEHQMGDSHSRYNCAWKSWAPKYWIYCAGLVFLFAWKTLGFKSSSSYGELVNGKYLWHKPKKRYKDCLKYNFQELDIDYNSWKESPLYYFEWRKTVGDGCSLLEGIGNGWAKLKLELCKWCAPNLPSCSASWIYETCGRVLLSKASYMNH